MYGGNNNLVQLQVRQVFFHYRGTLHQYRRFVYFSFFVYYFCPCLTVILIPEMCRFPSIMFQHHMMAVCDQYPYSFRRQGNPVFLESSFFGNTNMQLGPLGFYIKFFFERLVTKRGADDWLKLGHESNSGLSFTMNLQSFPGGLFP